MLPESCVSVILSLTSPSEACKYSLVSTTFQSAAESDLVWERFLPSDYQEIVSNVCNNYNNNLKFSSKKELFLFLCNPLLMADGKLSFKLERSTGRKSYVLSARELVITWSNDPMFWVWKSIPESRFSVVAELRTVSWLEIQGKIRTKMLSPNTKYGAYLIVKITDRSYGLDSIPSEISVQVGNNQAMTNTAYLCSLDIKKQNMKNLFYSNRTQMLKSRVIEGDERVLNKREEDGNWMEIELGEFFNGENDDDEEEVKMSLKEIKGQQLKGGLIIEDCFAHILSFTSPIDACQISLVSPAIRAMADSDNVWEKFLPVNYEDILLRLMHPFVYSSKKELYFRLCNPHLIDGGNKTFSLDKSSGKKCFVLSARALNITWAENPLYWTWKSFPASRFYEVAELRTIWWLEIQGKIDSRMLSPNIDYEAYLIVKFVDRAYGLDILPSKVSVEIGNHGKLEGSVYLRQQHENEKQCLEGFSSSQRMRSMAASKGIEEKKKREDGWIEIELGDCFRSLWDRLLHFSQAAIMFDDQDLGFFANFLGIFIFVLVIAYHYVMADPKYAGN
ncbi:hypothetical protein COLO4_14834 [Corchorus olitorius]|uniref:F-box domain-containing protein n=1 Tax=Corchorus olitorius TaxID=93759 RepID=A0A1R3JQR0_9ROSI|nr:hypothetical protein COLO4_14834 [Corchorus olitorius]